MEVILVQDVEKLGKKGERVNVKGGYFRNYLFPRQIAIPCTEGNKRTHEEGVARRREKEAKEKEQCLSLARKLENRTVTLEAHAGEEDKLFGSITHQEIAKALEAEGYAVDKRKIEVEEPIKKLGSYPVKIKLHPEVETSIQVKVVKG